MRDVTILLPAFQDVLLENISEKLNGFSVHFSAEFLEKVWQKSQFIKKISSPNQEIKKTIFAEYFFLDNSNLENELKFNPFSLEGFWAGFIGISVSGPCWNNLAYGQSNFFYLSLKEDSRVPLIVCIKRVETKITFSCLETNSHSKICFGDQLFFT